MARATTSISNWNRATQHVSNTTRSGSYVNAETTLIFAGPPRLEDVGIIAKSATAASFSGLDLTNSNGKDAFYPIGLIESAAVQQVQNVQKLYEIGSRRSYQAGGRVQVVGSLGRIVSNEASLLRALYAYYPNSVQLANGRILAPSGVKDDVMSVIVGAGGNNQSNPVFPPIFLAPGAMGGTDPESGQTNVAYMNLMSELFSHPFGFGFALRSNDNRNYTAFYLEDCFITTHSFQIGSTSTLITEAVNIQADAAIPLEFSTEVGQQINAAFAAFG